MTKIRNESRQPTEDEMIALLRDDLSNDLSCLCVAAVTWYAVDQISEGTPHQKMVAMDAAILHARAIYEFYFYGKTKGDDARAREFVVDWAPQSDLYTKYMSPANKRLFHLVYNRSKHSGGSRDDENTHIKEQAFRFAKDLLRITEDFIALLDSPFVEAARSIVSNALTKSDEAAAAYKVSNPLRHKSPL